MADKIPKKRGCLKLVLIGLAGLLLVAWCAGEWFFNLGGNLVAVAVKDSRQALQMRTSKAGWKTATSLTPAEASMALVHRHTEPGLRWSTLKVRRPAGALGSTAQAMLGAEVHVVTISPEQFEFMTTFRPQFAPTTAAERMETENLCFAITANFRDPAGKPLGYVWHEGRQLNPTFPEWSGCFFVKGSRPYFGPKSLLDEIKGPIEEAAQGYPSVMKNHSIFSYVDLKPDTYFDGSKITYRSLAGMKKDGTIVFILSGAGGVMNVSEVSELARKLDVQHATLLDGGRALQYSVRTEDGPWHFASYNTRIPTKHRWFEQQLSPVFIGVRRRAPEIISMGGRP